MPLNNYFYGVYNIASINATGTGPTPYLIKSLKSSSNMEAAPAFFMQGTVLTKVLDVKHTKETISIDAPILVTSDYLSQIQLKDGRALLNDMVYYKYGTSITSSTLSGALNVLPILTKASIHVSVDQSTINFTLLSDGDPNNTINVYTIKKGTTALLASAGIANTAARIAKNWDFFANLGGLNYYVKELTMDIDIENKEFNFLGAADGTWTYTSVPGDGLNAGKWDPAGLGFQTSSYSGWQFPFIAVGGVKITAKGKAAVAIDNLNRTTNFTLLGTSALTRAALLAAGNVTLQDTGMLSINTSYNASNFTVYMSLPATANSPLGVGVGTTASVLPAAFAVNNALITMKDASFSADAMEVDFEVLAFVTTGS